MIFFIYKHFISPTSYPLIFQSLQQHIAQLPRLKRILVQYYIGFILDKILANVIQMKQNIIIASDGRKPRKVSGGLDHRRHIE